MEAKFLKITSRDEWQGLLDKVLFKTFFHNIEWEEFLESQFKWLKFERYLWNNQALLSLARVRVRGKEKLISHPFCEYGGPLPLSEEIDGAQFQKDLFEEFSAQGGSASGGKTLIKINLHPKLLDYFEGLQLPKAERETFLFENIDQKPLSEIWRILDRNRRRSIKTAGEQGFKIKKCENEKELKVLYDLYVKTLKKHKVPFYPFSFFRFFLQSPKSEIVLAVKGKDIIGGNVFVFYDNSVHSFLCGFRKWDKKQGAHSLILWNEIEKIKERGWKILDLGGTKKDSPVEDFKRRWGAIAYPIYELKNYSDEPGFKRSFLRNLWGLLPSSLIKVLSPHFIKYKL